MKKILTVFLSFIFALSAGISVFAVELSDITLNYLLTYEGKHTATVPTGTVITVDYAIENVTDDSNFMVFTIQNEIYYDHHFFEFVEDSFDMEFSSLNTSDKVSEGPNHKLIHEIYINDVTTQEYQNYQYVGSFQLKVIAESGSSTIQNNEIIAFADGQTQYRVHDPLGNLTITVGDPGTQPKQFTVTYISEGETKTEQRVDGEVMKLPEAPDNAPEGKVFDAWQGPDGKKYQPGDEYTVTGDVTFTALWKDNVPPETETFTLRFDTNGGSSIEAITMESDSVVDLTAYRPSRSGYRFDGWFSDEALTDVVESITLTEDTTVFAKWTRLSGGSGGSSVTRYTLAFETNGGTSIDSVLKFQNVTVDLSKYITTRAGYSFDGWYTDEALTNRVTSIKITADTTLYAKWTEGEGGEVDEPNYHPDILTTEHIAYITGRDEGIIAPQENLTRAEAAVIFFRLLTDDMRAEAMTYESHFSDVATSDWFNTAVSTLVNLEVLNGRTEDRFAPDEPITRAELTTIVARLSEAKYEGEDLFTDIAGHWAQQYINIAASINWVTGDDGKFRPDDHITRAEVMTLINRALNRLPETADDLLDGMILWSDNSNESSWYYIAVQEATNSHNFEMKPDGVHEKWTELTENPDWFEMQ